MFPVLPPIALKSSPTNQKLVQTFLNKCEIWMFLSESDPLCVIYMHVSDPLEIETLKNYMYSFRYELVPLDIKQNMKLNFHL